MMLKQYFEKITADAVSDALDVNALGQMSISDFNNINLTCEVPKNPDFGDFAINISSLSRFAKLSPLQIAEQIVKFIKIDDCKINVVAGFINYKLENSRLSTILNEILAKNADYGKGDGENSKSILLEYVSANPTGPFHIGHGRWAAMGSALANLLKFAGHQVFQEFYINDAGSQIAKLFDSVYIRIQQQLGFDVDFPTDEIEMKKYYTGEFLVETAKRFVEQNQDIVKSADFSRKSNELLVHEITQIEDFAKNDIIARQKELLSKLRVNFDNFYSEMSLYKTGKIQKTVEQLTEKQWTYEKDGALWLKSTKYGDDQDRVLEKSDGTYTYLSPDIAYHKDKFDRGFTSLINIWGADHHGYIPRVKAALEALGYNPDALEVLLGQLVNLVIKGEHVRMGKRSKMITLQDLVDEVGVDATRFWMIMRSIDTTLDFDVELAKSSTDENPVFYVQYAHARACSILRNVTQSSIDTVNNTQAPALIDEAILNELSGYVEYIWNSDDEKAVSSARTLILKLEEFKSIVHSASIARAPYMICKYTTELASVFHHFYAFSRVIVEDKNLMLSRLALVKSFKTVLKNALDILAINAPQKM